PLIGDPDPRRPLSRGGERLAHRLERDPQDLLGVVLDPAGLRVMLGEFAIAAAEHAAVLVDQERGGAGGALVESEDAGHQKRRCGTAVLTPPPPRPPARILPCR